MFENLLLVLVDCVRVMDLWFLDSLDGFDVGNVLQIERMMLFVDAFFSFELIDQGDVGNVFSEHSSFRSLDLLEHFLWIGS